MKEETTKPNISVEVTGQDDHEGAEAGLPPRDTEVWTTRPANVEDRSWTGSSSRGGSVLGFPSTAVPAFGWKKSWKNCQLLSS